MAALFLGLLTTACQQEYTVEESEIIARDFVQNEATFRFDGIAETLKLTNTGELGVGSWEFTFRYDSRASGYGDRTGQILLQVITPHEARATVEKYKVTKAIMDNRWDMITQKLIGAQPTQTPTPIVTYSVPELEYRLISHFGNVFYVDPDFYPVPREGAEEKNALEQFPIIRANDAEFSAILGNLGLPNEADYTLEEKVHIYREHKKLSLGVQVTASGGVYSFTLRIGESQGWRIEGTITPSGEITVTRREPSFNIYPICLAKGTLIDTLSGPVPVEQLRKGMVVWTVDDSGKRALAVVEETRRASVPSSFRVVRLILNDGRTVTASPGHPTADGRAVGDLQVGDALDRALVLAVEYVPYDWVETYDLLPSGVTGLYWANGILLRSTLAGN